MPLTLLCVSVNFISEFLENTNKILQIDYCESDFSGTVLYVRKVGLTIDCQKPVRKNKGH